MAKNARPTRKGKYRTPSRYNYAGRLVKDPEPSTFTHDGKEVKLLKLTGVDATTSEKHVDFFPTVTVSGARVEFLSKLKKGDYVVWGGKPEIRTYEGRGGWGFELEVRFPDYCEAMAWLGDRDAAPTAEAAPPVDDSAEPTPPSDDIPF